MRLSSRWILILGLFATDWVNGGGIPEAVLPAGVGVNIHFTTGHEKDLDLIAAAGFSFIRMDFAWSEIERKKEEYDWSAYEGLLKNLEGRGIRPLFILDYSNPLYEETVSSTNPISRVLQQTTASPQHPESVAAFSRWAAAAAQHFRNRGVLWEIWNEPNIQFWAPKPDADQYATLALATCRAVRKADPGAAILGPASAGFAWAFIETLFQAGALEYLDAVSVHPYRSPKQPPETAAPDYAKLRALIERYAPEPRKNRIPIISGEWGYSTHAKGVSLETQAAYIVRQQLVNLLEGIPLSIWYDWKNDGDDPNENEHNFGTVTSSLEPKPAYTAIQTFTRQLSGYGLERRLGLADQQDYVLVCTNRAGEHALAAWTIGEPHSVAVLRRDLPRKVSGTLGNGAKFTAETEPDGTLKIRLSGHPQFFVW